MRKMGSTREAFGNTMLELAREGYDIVAVTADTSKSLCVDRFAREFPARWFDTGIAEQCMMTVAAGLASAGKTAFAATYSVFTSMRCAEEVRTFVAYPGLNVKIVAALGGLSAGIEGVTHIALEDLGMMRCIPNLVILNPADATATARAVRAAADHHGPVYIRLGRDASPVVFDDSYRLSIGKANCLRSDGGDVGILVTGSLVLEAGEAADLLAQRGIRATVLEFPTIKPIDEESICSVSDAAGAIVTVEEHNVIGGLGSAVAEVVSRRCPSAVEMVGIQDRFVESDTPADLRIKYGLTAENIAAGAVAAMRKRDEWRKARRGRA